MFSQFIPALVSATSSGLLRPSPNASALPGLCDTVPQSAGYFDIAGTKDAHYFYWSFTARSKSLAAPTILWMTGGPGCSSGIALFHENGPCKINEDHKTTKLNPWSWNAEANIVFIDQPAGVGFSYGDDNAKDEADVASHMVAFLEAYSAANSDVLKTNELFIFGESYGGHYAPATAAAVANTDLNLVGLGVGNGLTDPIVQYPKYAQMGYNWSIAVQGHPVLDLETYTEMMAELPQCLPMIAACQTDTSSCANAQSVCNSAQIGPYEQTGLNPYDIRVKCAVPPLCYDFSDVEDFLDLASTRAALGVAETTPWQSCNYTVNAAFANDWMKNMAGHVTEVLAVGVRVLIYAGDVDFICNCASSRSERARVVSVRSLTLLFPPPALPQRSFEYRDARVLR